MTDLASIAVQIQDRALILVCERGLRDVAEVERDQAQYIFEKESKQNSMARRTLLKVLRSRHGFELELFRIKEQQEEQLVANKKLLKEADRLNEQAEEMEGSWKRSVDELYAEHKAKRQLYQQFLESRIHQRQRQTKLEDDRVGFLERRAREMQADEKELAVQMERVEEETKVTDSREEEEDEEVSSLALQIKATLSKVRCICI
jgi:hypothetical protein